MRSPGNTHLYQLDNEALQNLNKKMFTSQQICFLAENVEAEA